MSTPNPYQALADELGATENRTQAVDERLFAELEHLNAELARRAVAVFGTGAKAASYLARRHPALGHRSVYEALASGDRQRVFEVLDAIEHGHHL